MCYNKHTPRLQMASKFSLYVPYFAPIALKKINSYAIITLSDYTYDCSNIRKAEDK